MALFDWRPKIGVIEQDIKQQYEYAYQTTYAPVTTRTYDIQYNIASEGSTISTKKEQAISQTPTITPQIIQIPTQTTTTPTSSSSVMDYLVIGGLIIGAVLVIPAFTKKK